MNIGGNTQVAESPDQDRIELAIQLREAIGRYGYSIREIAIGAPIEVDQFDGCPAGFHHLDRLRDHFFADSIAGNDCDALLWAHVGKGTIRGDRTNRLSAARFAIIEIDV